MRKTSLLFSLSVLLSVLCVNDLWAGIDPPVIQWLQGRKNQLQADSVTTVEDTKFFDPAYNNLLVKPYKVQNRVSLKIDETANVYLQGEFTAMVQIRVYRTKADNSVDSVDRTLSIHYKSGEPYKSIASYVFTNAYRVQVKVLSASKDVSWNVWPALVVENELQSYPVYHFSCTNNAVQSVSRENLAANTNKDELFVSWDNQIAADEYDVEWAYIDSSSLASGRYHVSGVLNAGLIFENNATRVTITGNWYKIPLLYDNKGALFFRVRSVQWQAGGGRSEAIWSSAFPNGLGRFDFDGHQGNLNWQATTTFAEEGKRKSVVQYFDGSLRNRQTVTKDNTTHTTLVSESYYDYQGRPVIQVMPTPTLDSIIKYSSQFNRALNDSSYGKDDFDFLPDPAAYCNSGAAALNSNSGTAKYYSSSNPNQLGINRYIPDAEGYPFTEVQYTQDNTGRISKQSGVGASHRLGSGHETIYAYGVPDQKELDALFGTEVGHYSHYFKNMVRDANGQYSVSYMDMRGRTIATALAGNPPPGIKLDKLASNNSRTITEKLADPASALLRDLVIESKKGLLVSSAGNHSFSYRLDPDSLLLAGCDSSLVCYGCLYDLTITITDDCNNQKLGGKAFDTTIRNFSIGIIDTACGGAQGFSVNFTKYLEEGSYEVTKKLSVSRYGMDYYRDSVFRIKNTCKTLDDFIEEQRQLLTAASQCVPSCQSCTDSLGTWDLFRDRFMNKAGIVSTDSAGYRGLAWQAFVQAKEDCQALCAKVTELDDIRKQMLLDMTPPSGQYANLDSLSDRYSIFYSHVDQNGALDTVPKFILPTNYLDGNGVPDQVFDEAVGTMVSPQQLSAEAFVQKFKLSWAEALLPYHPEYCKLKYQEDNLKASSEWDLRFSATETYQEALAKGFLNPTNKQSYPFTKFNGQTGQIDSDPLSGIASFYRDSLEAKLGNYTGSSSSASISLWAFATAMTKCATQDAPCFNQYTSLDSAFVNTLCVGDLDMAWRTFRELYLNLKKKYTTVQLIQQCPAVTTQMLVTAHRQPHFGDVEELALAYGAPLPPAAAAASSQVQQTANNFYNENCIAYAVQWWAELKPCAYNQADSAVIIPRLVQVCKEGSDASRPFGASTVRPSSTYPFKSFEAVLKHFSDSSGKPYNTYCNAFLITSPLPYDKQGALGNQQVWMVPDSCQCTQVNNLYVKYQQSRRPGQSFSNYLFKTTGTKINSTTLDSLMGLCNGNVNCTYLSEPISLPPVFQCGVQEVCSDCLDFAIARDSFEIRFPGAVPAPVQDDTAQLRVNRLFTNYMNQYFGFSKTISDYLTFISTCDSFSTGLMSPADSLSQLVNDFKTIYSALGKGQVYKDYKITPAANAMVDAANALVKGMRQETSLPPGYGYASFATNFNAKLRSVISTVNGSYHVIVPLPLTYTYVGDSRVSELWDTKVSTNDFATAYVTEQDLGKKYYASVVNDRGNHFQQMWSSKNNPGAYAYYGLSTPLSKYLPSNLGIGENHVFSFTFYKIPAGIQTPTEFSQFFRDSVYSHSSGFSSYAYTNSQIKEIKNLRLATNFLFANEASCFNLSSRGLQVTLKLSDGTETDAYVYNTYDCSPQVQYKEPIDSNLYNSNCQEAFAYFFNGQKGTNYSFAQIDSLYQAYQVALTSCDTLAVTDLATVPQLCGKSDPVFPPVNVNEVNNCSDSLFFIVSKATELHQEYSDSLQNHFDSSYLARCLRAYQFEDFTVTREVSEYHYTLYYYDQAGNLVKTVPPEGVQPVYRSSWLDSVEVARAAGQAQVPEHGLVTQYSYNTLNQVVRQVSPDGGLAEFWYDRLGRLALSQNARQKTASGTEIGRQYSYTLYDGLGRITEVGQLSNASTTPMNNTLSRSASALAGWLSSSTASKEQVTQTVYDLPYGGFAGQEASTLVQRHLRNRVSYTNYTNGSNLAAYSSASFYSYDAHGNVDTLLQDYGHSGQANVMNQNGQRFKKLVYRYDLVSGKVNHVAYQPGKADQFFHRYSYDADNRLVQVETSADSVHWERDARYAYYKHGPLARMVLGAQQVQGVDYAYTLQGWLKGVNSTALDSAHDMGADGKSGEANQYVARDAYSFNLNYFNGDYVAIGGANPFPGTSAFLDTAYRPLYNGNISSMAVNITQFNSPMVYAYRYDQLNRLTGMDAFGGSLANNYWTNLSATQTYRERVTYDGNGNILKYLRNGQGFKLGMDSLSYHYSRDTQGRLVHNRLNHVRDNINAAEYAEDLDNQSPDNYSYDAIGNLTGDASEGITNISWNVYGKISQIELMATSANPVSNIKFTYDAAGNRTSKRVERSSGSVEYTWYVRDAQGNVLATYRSQGSGSDLSAYDLQLSEQHLYGSSRLGIVNRSLNVESAFVPSDTISFTRGLKYYELANHLGNVLATISDKKLGHSGGGDTVDYYQADVVSANDYYPFGMMMPGRQFSAGNGYRYGFNSKELDDIDGIVQYDYGFRIYDPRLGRFKSVDPLMNSYPYYTPYQFAGNMPIAAIDLDGLEEYVVIYYKDQNNNTTKIQVRAIFENNDLQTPLNQNVHKIGASKNIAKGNVLVFEIKKEENGKESMKIIDHRESLNKLEKQIFKTTKDNLEKEKGPEQTLAYGTDKPNKDLYESEPFVNSETKAFSAEKTFGIAPPKTSPETPPSVTELKKEKVIVEMEIFTKHKPGSFGAKADIEMLTGSFKSNYDELKKMYNADSLILKPTVHYNQKWGPGDNSSGKTLPVRVIIHKR